MMPFIIVNRYYFELNFLEPEIHRLNENHLEDLKLHKISQLYKSLFFNILLILFANGVILCNFLIDLKG